MVVLAVVVGEGEGGSCVVRAETSWGNGSETPPEKYIENQKPLYPNCSCLWNTDLHRVVLLAQTHTHAYAPAYMDALS